jgi:hypothetical protein
MLEMEKDYKEGMGEYDLNAALVEVDDLNQYDVGQNWNERNRYQRPRDASIEVDAMSQSQIAKESKDEMITDILEHCESQYQRYLKERPNYRDFESFLRSLPIEHVDDIRRFAQEGHYYGHATLEQELMNQYGVVFQIRDFNNLADGVVRRVETAIAQILEDGIADVEDTFERKMDELSEQELAVERKFAKFEENFKVMEERLIHNFAGAMSKIILAKSDELKLEKQTLTDKFRNDLMEPIKKDVRAMKKDIFDVKKDVKEGAKQAFEEVGKTRSFGENIKLLAYVAVGGLMSSALTVTFLKMAGMLH